MQPGEAVAFQLPNWREAVVSFAALALGGYVLVPIVHIYGRKEVAFILEQSGAAAYISPLAYGHVDYGAIVETAAPASLRLHVVVGDTEASPSAAGPTRIRWEECARQRPAVDLPRVESRRDRGARVHLRDHQRPQGRDPRSPHDAERAAPHGGLHDAGKAQPDGLARHPCDRDARRRARPAGHRRGHPPDRPLGSGPRARGDAGRRASVAAPARRCSSPASWITPTSPRTMPR